MLFLVLNIIFSVFLIYLTVYIDRKNSLVTTGSNPIVAYLMMFAINVCLFTFFLLVRKYITPLLFSSLIKLCFILEGCMLINVSFCLTYYAWKYTNGVNIAIKTFLMIFVVWLVMFNFQSIKYSEANGLEISSKYIFSVVPSTTSKIVVTVGLFFLALAIDQLLQFLNINVWKRTEFSSLI